MTVYGITNCDTVKKSLKWLDSKKINYTFHDLKKETLKGSVVKKWIKTKGLDKVVNKKSTTWRGFSNKMQDDLLKEDKAIPIIIANPTLIKRPVIEVEKNILIGFDEEEYKSIFKIKSTNK